MKLWSRFPVFRVLIPFAFGIIYCLNYNVNIKLWCIVSLLFFCFSLILTTRNYFTGRYAQRWLAGFPFYITYFSLGVLLIFINNPYLYSGKNVLSERPETYIVEIIHKPSQTLKGYRCEAKLIAYFDSTELKPVRGKISLFYSGLSSGMPFQTNDLVALNTQLQTPDEPRNPNNFDYKNYLETKGIVYTAFVDSSKIKFIKSNDKNGVKSMAFHFREMMLSAIHKYLPEPDRQGVAGALLLGYDDWLEDDLQQNFASAGVLHVLCVSGMHVGLIYMILTWVLKWMDRKKLLRSLKFILLLMLIWFYALVTGLAPSVMRASTMLSFVIVGKWLDKNSNVYNLLCISCVFLFNVNPYLIVSVGFQLSFLAVCGIIFIHPLIVRKIQAPNTFLHRIWEMMSVSIAAQIATFPLSIYLFHQFPNYFILGNLMVLPLVGLIMYSGLALLACSHITLAGNILGFITGTLIDLMNRLVNFVSNLPGAISDCFLSFPETILLYTLIILITAWIVYKFKSLLLSSMLCLLLLMIFQNYYSISAHFRHEFVVYYQKNSTLLAIINGRHATILSDREINDESLKYSAADDLRHKRINSKETVSIAGKVNLWLPDEHILIINKWSKNQTPRPRSENLEVKFLIIGGEVSVNVEQLLNIYHPEKVIISSALSNYKASKINEVLRAKGVSIHLVPHEGYFRREL